MGSHYVDQAGLKLLASSDPPISASQSAGITGEIFFLPRLFFLFNKKRKISSTILILPSNNTTNTLANYLDCNFLSIFLKFWSQWNNLPFQSSVVLMNYSFIPQNTVIVTGHSNIHQSNKLEYYIMPIQSQYWGNIYQ